MTGVSRDLLTQTLNAEADWVAIQAALLDARSNGHGWVVIPDSAGDYIVDRSVAIFSNTILEWTGARFIRMNEPSERGVGAVLSNLFPYDSDSRYLYNDEVCFVRILNPRIDAGGANGVPGENGIAFANGAQDIKIVGGEIRNARLGTDSDISLFLSQNPAFDCSAATLFSKRCPNKQGGKGVQAEAGVKDVLAKSLLVTKSTVGFSASAGHGAITSLGLNLYRANGVRNIAWNVRYESIRASYVDIPVLFSNIYVAEGGTAYLAEASQATKFELVGLTATESGWISTPNLGARAAIVGTFGAYNLTVDNVVVTNATKKIRAIFRGFAYNVAVTNVQVNANTSTLFSFEGSLLGANYSNSKSQFWDVHSFSQKKSTDYAVGGSQLKNFYFSLNLANVAVSVASPSIQILLNSATASQGYLGGALNREVILVGP